ncbi:MAG: alpha/beta fold hydrolase [Bacteroidales bacterium]
MELFYREIGEGEPVVILHGLYGSSDNWMSIARVLSSNYKVILVDQRNHGRSPHSMSHSYKDMVDDLKELLEKLELQKVSLMGHSMGGKTATLLTAQYPERVNKLIVVDILPIAMDVNRLEQEHGKILSALLMLRPELASTRSELDATLAKHVKSKSVRQFLLKNIKRDKDGAFQWTLNVEAISYNLSHLMGSVFNTESEAAIDVPTLFIKGEMSDYIPNDSPKLLDGMFNNYKISIVPNAGHWLHAENPKFFLNLIEDFLQTT